MIAAGITIFLLLCTVASLSWVAIRNDANAVDAVEHAHDETRQARGIAERLASKLRTREHDIEQMRRDLSFVVTERDAARSEIKAMRARNAARIAKGNHTRVLRRHGALYPASDTIPAEQPAT